ncbi:MAG: vacuolar-type H+-ATPase subunit H [Herpetosiphon sp.]
MEKVTKPDELLSSFLTNPEASGGIGTGHETDDEDVDLLIDELEQLFGDSKRVPFGKKLMVDEDRALAIVDRLRTALPGEVRQAHRVLDEQDRIIKDAESKARRILEERGLQAQLIREREQIVVQATAEAERMRADADSYIRKVLQELNERLIKLQGSVQHGIEALDSEP